MTFLPECLLTTWSPTPVSWASKRRYHIRKVEINFCKEFCRSVSGKHEENGSCIFSPNSSIIESTNVVSVSSVEKTSSLFFSQMHSQKNSESNNTEIGYNSVLTDFSCDDSSIYLKNGNFCMPKCLKSPSPDQLPMPPTQWVSAN
ncbi:hypothetical protein T09_5577 [Trichinella sp. T9]|nr:hypothetical protein T09_5577 [Trichinella sp. T9]